MNQRSPLAPQSFLNGNSPARRGLSFGGGNTPVIIGAGIALLILLFALGLFSRSDSADANSEAVDNVSAVVTPALTRAGYGYVDVDADGRTVTLSGEVPTHADVVAAVAVATSIEEVASVNNNLTYAGEPDPGSPEAAVSALGPDAVDLQARLSSTVSESGISFETGSTDLTDSSRVTVASIATLLNGSNAQVQISGHTDSDGNAERNQTLSLERAEAVAQELQALGIDSARLNSVGFGDSRPIASNDTDDGKAKNRRIEFLVTG